MKRKTFNQIYLLFFAVLFISFATGDSVYAFGLLDKVKKSTGDVLLQKETKPKSKSSVGNVEEMMAEIFRKIMPANNIEARGRSMIIDAMITVRTTEKIISETSLISGYISRMTDSLVKLKEGEKITVQSAKNLQEKLLQNKQLHKKTCEKFSALRADTKIQKQKLEDTKPQSKDLIEKTNSLGNKDVKNDYLNKIGSNVKNIQEKSSELDSIFQKDVLSFYMEAENMEKKRIEFSNNFVRPAIKGIGYTVGYMKGLIDDYPKIDRLIKKIEKKSKKNGKELITEGIKVLGVLAIQQDSIRKLIMQLKEDPLNNLQNIKELKKLTKDIVFYIQTIKKYNAAIKKVNEHLSVAANNISSVNSSLRNANNHSRQILDGITTAYAKVLSEL
jgi:hypothetical protein